MLPAIARLFLVAGVEGGKGGVSVWISKAEMPNECILGLSFGECFNKSRNNRNLLGIKMMYYHIIPYLILYHTIIYTISH